MRRVDELYASLPHEVQMALDDEGREMYQVWDAAITYMKELHANQDDRELVQRLDSECGQLADENKKLKAELNTSPRMIFRYDADGYKVYGEADVKRLEVQNSRMLKVLTKFGKIVTKYHDFEADLEFTGDQGSESREFEHGTYCGRTSFANDLMNILLEKEGS